MQLRCDSRFFSRALVVLIALGAGSRSSRAQVPPADAPIPAPGIPPAKDLGQAKAVMVDTTIDGGNEKPGPNPAPPQNPAPAPANLAVPAYVQPVAAPANVPPTPAHIHTGSMTRYYGQPCFNSAPVAGWPAGSLYYYYTYTCCGKPVWYVWPSAQKPAATTQPGAKPTLPYKVTAPTTSLTVNYRNYQSTAGHSVVGYGHAADPKTMEIELNGGANGPNTVRVDVYANIAKSTTPQWLASFVQIKGTLGKYPIDQAKLDEIAHQYIEMMNHYDPGAYSINKQVPPATLTLRVMGDGPNDNSPYYDLLGVLTVSTQLWNGPGPGPP